MGTAQPEPFYGSSEVTAVHEWLPDELGAASWSTPMVFEPWAAGR